MCTSIVVNKNKTIVGWNLDILDMQHRVRNDDNGVYIEIFDNKEGWLPLFGANSRGEFVAMPTCWPFDERSNPTDENNNIIKLNIDLLTQKKTFDEIKQIAKTEKVYSIFGTTFMSALSNSNGDVLHIIPGQGSLYYEKPEYKILTNFSPFKFEKEMHPWMGLDRYKKAEELLKTYTSFDVNDCFNVLKTTSQEICPTVVSMVYYIENKTFYWCENRNWADIKQIQLK